MLHIFNLLLRPLNSNVRDCKQNEDKVCYMKEEKGFFFFSIDERCFPPLMNHE